MQTLPPAAAAGIGKALTNEHTTLVRSTTPTKISPRARHALAAALSYHAHTVRKSTTTDRCTTSVETSDTYAVPHLTATAIAVAVTSPSAAPRSGLHAAAASSAQATRSPNPFNSVPAKPLTTASHETPVVQNTGPPNHAHASKMPLASTAENVPVPPNTANRFAALASDVQVTSLANHEDSQAAASLNRQKPTVLSGRSPAGPQPHSSPHAPSSTTDAPPSPSAASTAAARSMAPAADTPTPTEVQAKHCCPSISNRPLPKQSLLHIPDAARKTRPVTTAPQSA